MYSTSKRIKNQKLKLETVHVKQENLYKNELRT